jgi:hypothetical protein
MTEIYNASLFELAAPDLFSETFIKTIYYWQNLLQHFAPARDARDLVCNHRALAIC